jgi:hypothetical protein
MATTDSKLECERVCRDLFRCANWGSNDLREALLETLLREHRTLQQSMVRIINSVLIDYAKYHDEHPDRHDLRNESAIEYARHVRDNVHVYLPLV